eukprot:4075002-Prymnesium_polylepis.1
MLASAVQMSLPSASSTLLKRALSAAPAALILHSTRRCAPETLHGSWAAAQLEREHTEQPFGNGLRSVLRADSAERTTKPDPDGRL